jgi:hypothetical protein
VVDAIRNDAGELIGFAKITRDVTDRKNAERELAQAREALFQKMEAVGQLTGGVAHDFKIARSKPPIRSASVARWRCRDMQPTGPPALLLASWPSLASSPLSQRQAILTLWSAIWPTCSIARWASR